MTASARTSSRPDAAAGPAGSLGSRATATAVPPVAQARGQAPALIVIFARAPVPGRVKTRLVPALGARRAAWLHAELVEHTLEVAVRAGCGPVELFVTPRRDHPFFLECASRFGVRVRTQGRGDLGERMFTSFARSLRSHDRVILIGSDCPALRARDLQRAGRRLDGGVDAVISPAEDGGYALIGLRGCSRQLFRGIAWGGPDVLAQTERRFQALGWRWERLRTVWDVDRPEDVARLERCRWWPRTRATRRGVRDVRSEDGGSSPRPREDPHGRLRRGDLRS